MSILIVGKNPELLRQLESILEPHGHADLFSSPSVEETIEHLGLEDQDNPIGSVDLILLDMAGGGEEAVGDGCRRLSAMARDIPILFVAAPNDSDSITAALDAGAVDFVTIPVQRTDLRARIHAALRLKREIDTRKEREEELAEATRRLQGVSEALLRHQILDPVTEVTNRHHLEAMLAREWRRLTRSKLPLSLVIADIDFFKAFNEAYGHDAGDDCLKRVAEAMSSVISRAGDVMGRYGGEEFLVILPETHLTGAGSIAEALRAAVEETGIVHAFSSINDRVTVSMGVASVVPTQEEKYIALLQAAEGALHRAKSDGRNRVRVGEIHRHP